MTNPDLTNNDLTWIGLDFDRTIASTGDHDDNYQIYGPEPGAIEALNQLKEWGWTNVIYTARHWADHATLKRWLLENGAPADSIICGKPLFKHFVDDRALEYNPKRNMDWDHILKRIGPRI